MPLDIIYNKVVGQNRMAKYYSMELEYKTINGFLDPNGQTKKYNKMAVEFRCGVYEPKKTFLESVGEGINTTGGSITLYSSDYRAMGIKRGDKVIYDNEEYEVTDVNSLKGNKNSAYQRYTNNKLKVIVLT